MIKKPTTTYKPAAGSSYDRVPQPLPDISINSAHFDQLIQNRGILFTHTHALPCPNVRDINEAVHNEDCQVHGCENGMLQVMAKQVWGYFNNDTLDKLFEVQGEYNQNVAVITFAAKYTDGTECDMHVFDKLEMVADYSNRMYELVEASPSGIDRLRHRIVTVEWLQSSSGAVYKCGEDFTHEGSRITWISPNRPKYDQQLGRGEIFSVSYFIKPTYYVHHIMKEIRGTQEYNIATNEKVAVRLPQHVLVTRQLAFPDEEDKTGNNYSKFPRRGLSTPG